MSGAWVQTGQEEPSEQHAEDPDRQQKGRARRDPALAVERKAAAGHDHVDMAMVSQRRPPGVEHRRYADAGAEVVGVGGDGQHRLRRRAEQQVVDDGLVEESDGSDLGGQREDDIELTDWEQILLALGQPCARRRALALGAVPVAAAVVGDANEAAVVTSIDMAAERRGATGDEARSLR